MNRRNLLTSLPAGIAALAFLTPGATAENSSKNSSTDAMHRDYLDTPDGQIYFWTAGKGPNVVLVHQSGNSSLEYEGLVPLLAGQYRLIAIDLPGHGRSDDTRAEPTVGDYTLAVQRVLNALDVRKAHIVGHHGGALTAMNLATQEPERFDKMILSGTGAARSPEENANFLQTLVESYRPVTDDPAFMAGLWQEYLNMMSDGASVMDILKPFVATLEARQRPYRGIIANLKWDRRGAVKKLRGPVLLLQGDKDRFVSGQESLLSIIPNSTRRVMPGCGTFMFYDKAPDCAAMISDYLGT